MSAVVALRPWRSQDTGNRDVSSGGSTTLEVLGHRDVSSGGSTTLEVLGHR